MHLPLDEFCEIVAALDKSQAEKAIALLWFHDDLHQDVAMTAGALARIINDHHIGNPNSTTLAEAIRKTKLASEKRSGFYLKPGSRRVIRDWLPLGLDGIPPKMDHRIGYLSEAIWTDTRGYIETVCRQLNGCFKSTYYDAAAVMLRRLLETLIIECYEFLKREHEIKDANGDYFILKRLVENACGEKGHLGINLGRDCKVALKEARDIGNWSAHARRYNAIARDLTNIQTGVRIAIQELIQIANLKKG